MMETIPSALCDNWKRQQKELAAQVSHVDACVWDVPDDGQPSSDRPEALRYVAGLDISTDDGKVEKADPSTPEQAVACIVICELPSMDVVYEDFEVLDHSVPYKSGFLAFREVPAYSTLIRRLRHRAQPPGTSADPASHAACAGAGADGSPRPPWPQLFLVDGYGTLHHRRCGSASHLGVCCGIPTVGVAKTLLALEGLHERNVRDALSAALAASGDARADPPGPANAGGAAACAEDDATACESRAGPQSTRALGGKSGSVAAGERSAGEARPHDACSACVSVPSARGEVVQSLDLASTETGEVLGVAVAGMHDSKKPIYVSTGHMVSLRTAVRVTLACCVTRIPEPIRQADLRSRAYIRTLTATHPPQPRRAAAAAAAAVESRPPLAAMHHTFAS